METTDHDLLIKLDTNFQSFLKQYHIDMKELKDGTAIKLADHEARIRSIEQLRDSINPQQMVARLDDVVQWKRDFVIRWRTTLWIVGASSSLVTFILTVLAFMLNFIK